jgi:hypothetical protein
MPDVDLVRERDALKAEVQQLRQQQWYLSPACDTPDSPYGGNGLTWTQYAQAEYKRAETAEAEIERLKERMSSLENLGYWAARNAHGAWSHPAHFVNCPVQVCFDAKATLGKTTAKSPPRW